MARLNKLDHLDNRAIDARITLEHDHTRAPEKQFSCSIRLSVRGPDLFAEDRENDLYAAIDRSPKKWNNKSASGITNAKPANTSKPPVASSASKKAASDG